MKYKRKSEKNTKITQKTPKKTKKTSAEKQKEEEEQKRDVVKQPRGKRRVGTAGSQKEMCWGDGRESRERERRVGGTAARRRKRDTWGGTAAGR